MTPNSIQRVVLLFLAMLSCPAAAQPQRLSRGDLKVTEGDLREGPDHRFSVDVPKMRAVVAFPTQQDAEVRFQYLGPIQEAVPLGSGEMRRQIALKLQAQDPCNLLYVSWRIEPKSELVVSLKLNPSEHESAACENGGYRDLPPLRASLPPPLGTHQWHRLHAVLNQADLTVQIDDKTVWEGSVGDAALRLQGPVGLRTDNGRFDFEFFTKPLQSRAAGIP